MGGGRQSARAGETAEPTVATWPDGLLARVEDASLNASAPLRQRWLDGWWLRTAPEKAKRARSVQPVSDGHGPLDERLARAARAFQAAGLPMVLRLTPFSRPSGVDAWLQARGWTRFDDTQVLLADLAAPRTAAALVAARADPLPLQPLGPMDFAQAVGALRGTPGAQRLAQAERLANLPVAAQGWVLPPSGAPSLALSGAVADGSGDAPAACCGLAVAEEDLVGLYDVFTAPSARGHGLAGRLCAQLLAHASGQGARWAYLQVEADNAAARAVYARLGFRDAYPYHYRAPPA